MAEWPHKAAVLVTGAAGFIGSHLARRLVDGGAAVRVLSRDGLTRISDATVVVGDVTLPESLASAAVGCEVIFHCAALAGGTLSDAREVNVVGTRNVLEAAVQAGVRRVVHLSSVAIHGSQLPARVDESQPLVSNGAAYSLSKAEGEAVARDYHAGGLLQVVVVRPTCVYGPGSPTWVLAPFTRVRDEGILLVDGGRGLINLVYVDDLVDLLLASAWHPRAAGNVFVANGQAITWAQYLGAFALMLGKPLPAIVSLRRAEVLEAAYLWRYRFTRRPGRIVSGDIQLQTNRSVFAADAARDILGFSAGVALDDGMRRTAAWLRTTGYLPAPRYTSAMRPSAA